MLIPGSDVLPNKWEGVVEETKDKGTASFKGRKFGVQCESETKQGKNPYTS